MSRIAVGISGLNQGDIQKLARICGLLGSSHHGERAVAAVKASEILRANGLTWDEFVLKAFKAQTTKEEQPKRAPHWSQIPKTDREWIIAIQYECRHFITDWEICSNVTVGRSRQTRKKCLPGCGKNMAGPTLNSIFCKFDLCIHSPSARLRSI